MMFILPYFNRVFFRLTGRVYLGPMVTCLVFMMMMLTSNVCYIPIAGQRTGTADAAGRTGQQGARSGATPASR